MTTVSNKAHPSLVKPRATARSDVEKNQNRLEAGESYKYQVLGRPEIGYFFLCRTLNSAKFSTKSKKINKITKTSALDELGPKEIHLGQGWTNTKFEDTRPPSPGDQKIPK